jgi:phosphatidylinositol-3-phosphatase
MRTRLLALTAVLPLLAGTTATVAAVASPAPTAAASGPCGMQAAAPGYKHVIWIWMENHSYHSIIGSSQAPYINRLATECGLATNYHNVSHPSLPNYVSATSGLGYRGIARFDRDCDPVPGCVTPAASIFGQGETWKAYEESMPSTCHKADYGKYAVKHNPPPYFTRLRGCATSDVPYGRLASDLSAGMLPAFSFVTPNLVDDMHNGTVAEGDTWLAANLPTILKSPEYTGGSTAVFITWDEGEGGTATRCATNTTDVGCHVATIVISPSTRPGTRSAKLFNHYSLLGTAEQLLGLPALGKAASFPTMTSAFHL